MPLRRVREIGSEAWSAASEGAWNPSPNQIKLRQLAEVLPSVPPKKVDAQSRI